MKYNIVHCSRRGSHFSEEEYVKHDGAVCYRVFMETAFFRTLAEARVQVNVLQRP